MSRWEYIRRLEELLADIPPAEREEALQYYNDYINDSGKENEVEVMASLGTPEQVAATIKEGLQGSGGEFTEKGFRGAAERDANAITKYHQPEASPETEKAVPPKKGLSGGVIALIVIGCILASPLLVGIITTIFGIVMSCLTVIFSLLIAFGAAAVALLATAAVLLVLGIIRLFYIPLVGMALIAAALIIGGIGLLFLILTLLIAGKLIPAVIKGIASLFRLIFNRKGGK